MKLMKVHEKHSLHQKVVRKVNLLSSLSKVGVTIR